jgi:hypothetical protein
MPWQMSYWLPAEKWMPIYWPPYPWQIRDLSQPMQLPEPPLEGGPWPWWLYPKSQWPVQAPWEPKVFGAFSARKVVMHPENLHHWPPFGVIKVKTPTDHPHRIGTIKVHMPPPMWLDITPHPSLWAEAKLTEALRVMSRTRPIKLITDEGSITIKSMRSANWTQHRDDRPFGQPKPPDAPPPKPQGLRDLFA